MPSVDTGAPARTGASPERFPSSPRRVSLALFAVGLATFTLLYATQPLLPALTTDLGVTPGQASWTVSAATIGLAVAVLPLSVLSERFGRRTVMTCSLTLAVAVALALPFAPSIEALIALRALQGAAIAGIPASAMAYLADELPPRALVGAVGLFVAGNSVGGMSGRVLTGWAAEGWGWRAGLASVAVVSLVCAVVYRLLIPRARNFTPTSLRPAAVLRTVRDHLSDGLLLRLYSLGLLFMTVFGAVYTVIGYRLVAEPFGLSQGLVGSIFVIYLVGTVSSAAAGRLVERLGRRGAFYLAIGATSAGLLTSLGESLAAVLVGLVLITAGFFAGHAVASGSVSRTAKTGRAQASALYQMAYYLGSSLGASLGAVVYHAAGWSATVAFALGALVPAAGITLYATRRAPARRRPAVARSC
ncbi:MFS transporter [Streptomyces sp. TRM43335]|uniref:MFS transporter n=1 Tax=Streptomyces taklimakanensis TaxID=2569853 RepID=A0A6G2BEN2_9ACTN|nr:MFS transporter [Streptomyces taklimakanensis]MTE20718.1 MFS transporter [Streptomyces taklimakanensis]